MRWSRNTYEVIVMTCDPYLWAMQPFAYFFNKYWDDQLTVRVFGYKEPEFKLPANFSFDSLGTDTGPSCWSNGFLKALSMLDTKYCVFMLEDYWLVRPVGIPYVETVLDFMKNYSHNVMGVDLTNQGASNLRTEGYATFKSIKLFYNPCKIPYQFHLQTHMFDVDMLLNFVEPDWDPWECEREGTKKLWSMCPGQPEMLSTNAWPVQYEIAMRRHDAKSVHKKHRYSPEETDLIAGMIPPDWNWRVV